MDSPDDEPQTAMLLTQREWNDLEYMVQAYRESTNWVRFAKEDELAVKHVLRLRKLADRIIDANS